MPHGNECDNNDGGSAGGDGGSAGINSLELTLIIQTVIDAVI